MLIECLAVRGSLGLWIFNYNFCSQQRENSTVAVVWRRRTTRANLIIYSWDHAKFFV